MAWRPSRWPCAINDVFQDGGRTGPTNAIACAHKDQGVLVRVPPQYRLNMPRFLRVVRLIPHQPLPRMKVQTRRRWPRNRQPSPKPEAVAKPEVSGRPYRQQLADDLLDPARTIVAALRLEGAGADQYSGSPGRAQVQG